MHLIALRHGVCFLKEKRGGIMYLITLRHRACFLPFFCSWNDPFVAVSGSWPRSTFCTTGAGRR